MLYLSLPSPAIGPSFEEVVQKGSRMILGSCGPVKYVTMRNASVSRMFLTYGHNVHSRIMSKFHAKEIA